jgi:cell division protein FtsW (lipid II flippase)
MIRRSWRNFDYLLLGALTLLAVYGVTMIYSATMNTLGLENPLQRQIIFVIAGLAVLVTVASIDYRLLEILQHPVVLLTPIVLALASVAAVISWRAALLQSLGQEPSTALFAGDVGYMAAGIVAVSIVFLVDRAWAEKLDLWLVRSITVACLLGLAMAGVLLLSPCSTCSTASSCASPMDSETRSTF